MRRRWMTFCRTAVSTRCFISPIFRWLGDSMLSPLHYLTVNPGNAGRLIGSCARHGVKRFVFSSTANLFGAARAGSIDETAAIEPGSPYGESKWMTERMLG